MSMESLIDRMQQEATDDVLQSQLAKAKKALQDLETEKSRYEHLIDELEAELDRRALKSYWESHPDMLRVEVGDEVVITQSYVDFYAKNNGDTLGMFTKLGEIHTISNVYQNQHSYENEFRWNLRDRGGAIPYEIIQDMRRAYLDRSSNKQ